MKSRSYLFYFLIFLVAFSLNIFSEKKIDKKELLLKRVNKYWSAREKDDLVTAYNFLRKDSKKKITLTSFIRKTNIKVSEYEINKVEISKKNPDRGTVTVIFSGFAMGYPIKKVRNRQFWVFENGNWYVDYKITNLKDGFLSTSKNRKLNSDVRKKIMEYIKTHKIAPPKIVSPEKLDEKKNSH